MNAAYGPGVYDDLATDARLKARAAGVVLIVLGGRKGSGFSVQVDDLRRLQAVAAARGPAADDLDPPRKD